MVQLPVLRVPLGEVHGGPFPRGIGPYILHAQKTDPGLEPLGKERYGIRSSRTMVTAIGSRPAS